MQVKAIVEIMVFAPCIDLDTFEPFLVRQPIVTEAQIVVEMENDTAHVVCIWKNIYNGHDMACDSEFVTIITTLN